MEKNTVTLQDVSNAAKRIRPYIRRTPLLYEETLSDQLNCQVYLKPEMLQYTGAFKMRGALNKFLQLTEEEKEKGIICSSSGNHGRACAYLGKRLGVRVIVVLPADAPKVKIKSIEDLGGEIILGPRLYQDRWEMVKEEQKKHGYTLVHGYEDYDVMAGQGTIALEVLEDLKNVDTIIVPVGGGGLIAGIATAVKALKPDTRIIGVQAKASDAYVESFRAGKPVEAPCFPSLADALSCRRPGINPYPIICKYVDEFAAVTEEDMRTATKLVADQAKLIAEPSSCTTLAAVIGGQIKVEKSENVCFVLTSGNWDLDKLGCIFKNEEITDLEC